MKKDLKALVLAGGFDQIALIRGLQKRNFETILVDYTDEPPAAKVSDRFIRESTLDIDAVTRIASQEKVDIILTACTDQALLTMAQVSERLKLPCHISWESARNITNKRYMKSIFHKCGIPTANNVVLHDKDVPDINHLHFPLIVKPVDCNSSKGIQRVNDIDKLNDCIQQAKALSRTGDVIVEEFLDGQELSCDFYIFDGNVTFLSASFLHKAKHRDSFTITACEYEPNISDDILIQLNKIAKQIGLAFKINNCFLLIQVIIKEGIVYVIECSARMGGGAKYLLINRASGIDSMEVYLDAALGHPKAIEPKRSQQSFIQFYLYCRPGTYQTSIGFEQAKEDGLIDDYYFFKSPNQRFTQARNSGDRVAGIMVSGESLLIFRDNPNYILNRLSVLDEKGQNILINDFDYMIGNKD